MSAVVLIFDHPYFTEADVAGRYRLDKIPPGDYELVAWHERLKPQRQAVALRAGAEIRIDLVL